MKMSLPRPLGLTLVLAALSLSTVTGCRAKTVLPGAGNDTADQPVVPVAEPKLPPPIRANPFVVKAGLKEGYEAGKDPELQIEITNTSNARAQLQFTSGQKFDFLATQEGSEDVVWSWGMNKRFIQSLSSEFLEPGKSLKYEAKWEGAKPGTYTVTGVITANGGQKSPPFTVVVK